MSVGNQTVPPDRSCYAFGPFVLDFGRGILLKHGARVALSLGRFELLAVLVVDAEQILSKYDIIRRVWSGAIIEENNLLAETRSDVRVLDRVDR